MHALMFGKMFFVIMTRVYLMDLPDGLLTTQKNQCISVHNICSKLHKY